MSIKISCDSCGKEIPSKISFGQVSATGGSLKLSRGDIDYIQFDLCVECAGEVVKGLGLTPKSSSVLTDDELRDLGVKP